MAGRTQHRSGRITEALSLVAARRTRRIVFWGGALFALLNIAPFALGNVVFSEAFDALSGAGVRYASLIVNMSISRMIADAIGPAPALIPFSWRWARYALWCTAAPS